MYAAKTYMVSAREEKGELLTRIRGTLSPSLLPVNYGFPFLFKQSKIKEVVSNIFNNFRNIP